MIQVSQPPRRPRAQRQTCRSQRGIDFSYLLYGVLHYFQVVSDDDRAWEEVPSSEAESHISPSPRRRRPKKDPMRRAYASYSSDRQSSLSKRRTVKLKRPTTLEWPPPTAALRPLGVVFSFAFDILINSLKLLKYPLTLLLSLYLLSLVVARIYVTLTTPLHSLTKSLCEFPGVSLVGLDICQRPKAKSITQPNYPKLMDIESTAFEKLLDNSLTGVDLVFNLKKAEMASADLNTLLHASDMAVKTQLSSAIDAFVQDARIAGRALQRFDAKIEGTIDQLVELSAC